MSLSRREFATLLSSGALCAVLPTGVANLDQAERVSQTIAEPARFDPHVIGYFQTLLERHLTADKMLGPRQLLGPVLAQIDVPDGLRKHARPGPARLGSARPGPARPGPARLGSARPGPARPGPAELALRLLSQYAEFAGWLHQDVGDTSAAMYWSDRASQWAQAVGDYQMVAYMLVRKSNIAILDDNVDTVIELAVAARMVPGPVSPKLTALAAQQEARGWAMHGDDTRFQDSLDLAANLLRDHPNDVDEAAPVYLHHYDLETLEEQSASGYRACGQAVTAVAILERKIANTPDHLQRDQGHQIAKLASTVLATSQPDPERAADLGLRCVTTARQTGSARIAKELRALARSLSGRWPKLPGISELHEALVP